MSGIARAATAPYRIPITLTDSRVLVDCTIGSQGPFRFVVDTGGTVGLIELEIAKKLKLKQMGSTFLNLHQGAGNYPIFVVPDLIFAGQVRQPVSVIAGVDVVNFMDGAIGSLAAGVLTAGDCELDFETREWRIYRDGAPDRSGWSRFEKGIFHAGNVKASAFIAADATLAGHSFRFGLDTGWTSPMHIYRKTADATSLWNAPRWAPAAPDGKGRMVRAPLQLAGTMTDVIVTITEHPDWDIFPHGIIGLPVLSRFNMATQTKDETLYLKRNALPFALQKYNFAGLWIEPAGPNVKIGVVGAGSPAAKADLLAGDLLIGADFRKLRKQMFESAGTVIPLTVERAGARRDISLTLEDYL
ncbi:aspartyl protease family protein [Novosphingobium sp.]|uniref:aspartyl protease family protein n=1 Tax=Novosphingobium sp. TaxID=1874826 RepID=UPI0031D62740